MAVPLKMLLIIPTPIGNLKDITLRCLDALRECDVVFCEDTRRTLKLFSHYGIGTRLERYNEHDPRSVERALGILQSGKKAALVSDGGTPGISDPGSVLAARARESGITVISLPGPCAAVAALAGSGLPANSFVFLGFLPRSPSKIRKAISGAFALRKTVVVYESPFRIVKLLNLVKETFGPEIITVVVRELTKIHEEWLHGTVAEALEDLSGRKEILGEIVVLLHPADKTDKPQIKQ